MNPRSIPNKQQRGLTLLELLIVVGLIAIVASIGTNSFLFYQQTQRMNNARTELATTIERVRQYARRYNVSYTVAFQTNGNYASSTTNSSGTAITQIPGPPVTILPQIAGKLPDGMSFTLNAGSGGTNKNLVIYRAPFGRMDASKDCIGISFNALGHTFGSEIHIVGVTGRVLPRTINTNQTTALCP